MSKILAGQGASLPGQSRIPVPASSADGPAGEAGLELLGRAGMVAVRAADLCSPAGPELGKDGRTALTVARAGRIATGDPVVFLKPVAPAVVRRDGRVQAAGHPALTVRVVEYTVTVAGRDTPELFCLITDLHDHEAYPAGVLAEAYHWRWIGSETALKEAKSAISGAGPSTGPILRSQSPALIRQEHAAWVISVELARATARAAAANAVPARKGRRAGQPVRPREISFTAARRAVIAATRSGAATASLPAAPTRACRDRALADLARRRIVIDRDRHRDRKTKARLSFPHAGPRLATRTAPVQISICQPLAA